MALIDFKEIPEAHIATGHQDSFELFAKEFFKALGFSIISSPDRGPDDGQDLIIIEHSKGALVDVEIRWLVSCKHKAHSGSSVSKDVELDIYDRVMQHKCDGFIAFYSTLPSSSLNRKFQSLKEKIKVTIFDSERIEEMLMSNVYAYALIKRFFPESFKSIDNKTPSNIYDEYSPLICAKCGKDLLNRDIIENNKAVFVLVEDRNFSLRNDYRKTKYVDAYCACKGICDRLLEQHFYSLGYGNGWNDISDLAIPYYFLKFQFSILNRIRNGQDEYTDEAYEKLKDFILTMAQIVMKNQTDEDKKRIKQLQEIPDWA
jgi:hypothetical protein